MTTLNPYEILKIPNCSDISIVKKAFKELALIYHPDKGGDKDKFEIIYKAYNFLSDENKKSDWDYIYNKKEVEKRKEIEREKDTRYKQVSSTTSTIVSAKPISITTITNPVTNIPSRMATVKLRFALPIPKKK